MTQQPTIKAVVVDLDGTLLNSSHELTPRTEAALRRAIDAGIIVMLATGKTRNAGLPFIERLGLQTPGIFLQGLAVYAGDGTPLRQQYLNDQLARQVITFAEDRGFHVVAYHGTNIYMKTAQPEVQKWVTNYHEPEPEIAGPLQNLLNRFSLNKLMIVGEPRAVTALRWQLNLQIDGAGRIVQAGIPQMLEVLPAGASKGAALRWLLKDMKIAPETLVAIGDAENDIEMLRLAGIGVAMGNAAQAVKDAADAVVASNDEDGVAEAIERFVLPPAAQAPTNGLGPAAAERAAEEKSTS
jgi:Cof subfamily protein (haloacid dehalogenase superfamily)